MNLLWQTIPSTEITEILCSEHSIDGVVIDAEHGSFTIQNIVDSIRIAKLKEKQAFIRLKKNRRIEQIAIDNGCDGIIYSTCHEDPMKHWGIGLTRKNNYGRSSLLGQYVKLIAQIEDIRGFNFFVNNRHLICCDYYMLTPYDFSNALGVPGQFQCAKYLKHEEQFKKAVPPEKRACHIVENIEDQYDKYKDYGMKCFSLDSLAIVKKIEQIGRIISV